MGAKVLDATPAERAESSALPELQPLFPDAILWFLEAPDVVEVMSVIPYHPDDEDEEVAIPTGPRYLHGHYIRGTARVPTAARRRALAQALVRANREGHGWALCFDANYAVRVSRGGRTADFLICFWCGNVRVVVPGSGAKYPIGWSAARLIRRELRRGGVGVLWFWRRWLP
jgi:hypothetical protein